MILDAALQMDSAFSTNQAAATYTSANIIDLGNRVAGAASPTGIPAFASGVGARDIGIGDDPAIKVHSVVKTTVTSGGALTLTANLQGAPDNGSDAPGTWTTYATSGAVALAALAAGARLLDIDVPRPPAGIQYPRFFRMQYVIGGAAGTGGTVESDLVLDRFDQPLQTSAGVNTLGGYPAGITINN